MESIIQEILELVKKKMKEQGGYDRNAYRQFITETIDYFQEKGKIGIDENTEFIETRLVKMWDNVKESIVHDEDAC